MITIMLLLYSIGVTVCFFIVRKKALAFKEIITKFNLSVIGDIENGNGI